MPKLFKIIPSGSVSMQMVDAILDMITCFVFCVYTYLTHSCEKVLEPSISFWGSSENRELINDQGTILF